MNKQENNKHIVMNGRTIKGRIKLECNRIMIMVDGMFEDGDEYKFETTKEVGDSYFTRPSTQDEIDWMFKKMFYPASLCGDTITIDTNRT